MQNASLVSVIMPAFNPDETLLKEAIRSVFNQTYQNVEVIIGDDGSTTSIESYIGRIISDLPNQNHVCVHIARNSFNKGISSARNIAISNAKGKWLVWLDTDDTLQNDCIEKLVRSGREFNMVIGECDIYENNRIVRRKPKSYFEKAKKYFKTEDDPFLLNIISLQPQLILKSDFEEIGEFDENYRYAELTELFLRYVLRKGLDRITFIEGAIYNYNRYGENHLTNDREILFYQRHQILSLYLKEIGITGKKVIYKKRNEETGMQEYLLEENTVVSNIMKRGEGCIVADNVNFKGNCTLGHYVLIGAHDASTNDNSICIGYNVSIGSFTNIEEKTIIGDNVVVDGKCSIFRNVQIGNNTKILYSSKIFSNSIIGNDCIVGGDVPERMILCDRVTFMGIVAHSYRNASLDWDTTDEPSPTIGVGSVIGVHSILIGGITVGKNCFVSAGEILRHDLPDNSVYLKGEVHSISKFKGLIKTRF